MADRQSRTPRRAASAGLPPASASGADERLADLEQRLARLERSPGVRERSKATMSRMVPPESGHHFRNAGRENLLGIRSIVDFWIRRLDAGEPPSEPSTDKRERIEID